MEASLMAAGSENSAGQEVLPVSEGPLGCSEQEVQRAECLASIASGTGLWRKIVWDRPFRTTRKSNLSACRALFSSWLASSSPAATFARRDRSAVEEAEVFERLLENGEISPFVVPGSGKAGPSWLSQSLEMERMKRPPPAEARGSILAGGRRGKMEILDKYPGRGISQEHRVASGRQDLM